MTSVVDYDPLLLLRQSIASGSAIIPTTSPDTSSSSTSSPETSLSQATHLHFTHPARVVIPIDAPTRFVSNDRPVDLRSIYFAWLNREVAIPEYNASATKLNEELAGTTTVHKFAFVERLDLITWLEGASEESEYIKPLAGDKDGAVHLGGAGGAAAHAQVAKASATAVSAAARAGRGTLDPRLAQIYNGERRMGDRNTVLRGIKPTDFSHVRKLAQPLMARKPSPAGGVPTTSSVPGSISSSSHHHHHHPSATSASLALNQKPQRRPDPIILLSPSASSLLRMSNVKSFLEGAHYVPPDHNSAISMLHISRVMKDIDPGRPMRFILVEGSEQFKPEYWNRVVAVFTTGQAWQFKNYKWRDAAELFRHVLGIYLGWRGEQPPDAVRGFGHRVMACSVEKWRDPTAPGADSSRWRDREVVEGIWKAIEGNMRAKGWRKDAAPTKLD